MEGERGRTHRPPRHRPNVRPGPRTREAVHAAALEERRRGARERQRLFRARQAVMRNGMPARPQSDATEAEDGQETADQALYRSTINRHANRICGGFVRQIMRVGNADLRAAVMHKIFSDTQVRPLLPTYYSAPSDVRVERQILENLRTELQHIKNPHSSGKLVRKRSILEAVVSEQEVDTSRVHLVLGINKKNVDRAVVRIQAASDDSHARLSVPCRRKRQGGIPDDVKDAVRRWWTSETRVSPNRKDIRRKRVGRKVYERHPAHLLLESQKQLYDRFVAAHPECQIMNRSFYGLKPFFVIKCKDRNVCCCRYHVQILYLLEALNTFRDPRMGTHFLIDCHCNCQLCSATHSGQCSLAQGRFVGVTALWESLLCPKADDSEFHRAQCLLGECNTCGVQFMQVCPREEESGTITWKQFQYEVIGSTEDGRPKKRITEVTRTTTFSVFLDFFKPTLQRFVRHNFEARWQTDQSKLLRGSLQRQTLLSHIDFAENYTFQVQNEIQSMYYCSTQVTILVQVTFYVVPIAGNADGEVELIRETHYYLSDDRTHDTLFVQHCLLEHWRSFRSRIFTPTTHFVFSDGCAGQFKGARSMYFVARYPSLTGGCKMTWNFYGSGHGKGEWDGAGAVVKRMLRSEQLQNPHRTLRNARDCVTFLTATLAGEVPHTADRLRSFRHFHYVSQNDVDRRHQHNCDGIPGSSKFHSIFAPDRSDPTKLLVRELSCFCGPCLEEEFDECDNDDYIKPWRAIKLQPRSSIVTTAEDPVQEGEDPWDWEYSEEGMADVVQVGDNFAIPAAVENDEGVAFYILQCQGPKRILETNFQCMWGGEFQAGDCIIPATYYQKWGRRDLQNYVYLANSEVAHVDASSILACKFQMIAKNYRVKGGHRVYTLPDETVDVINTALDTV